MSINFTPDQSHRSCSKSEENFLFSFISKHLSTLLDFFFITNENSNERYLDWRSGNALSKRKERKLSFIDHRINIFLKIFYLSNYRRSINQWRMSIEINGLINKTPFFAAAAATTAAVVVLVETNRWEKTDHWHLFFRKSHEYFKANHPSFPFPFQRSHFIAFQWNDETRKINVSSDQLGLSVFHLVLTDK